ncbi:MAG: hypothetical protein WEB88_08170 [Gemmatimonadota bacterium]
MNRIGRLAVTRTITGLCLVVLLLACGRQISGGDTTPGEGVLFIGNSLTASNDLPGMVTALAEAAGADIPTMAVLAAQTSLEDHWYEGTARREIERGGWRAVVLQQGPSTLPESREHLIHWTSVYADAIRSQGGAPFVYMIWPPLGGDWERAIGSYRLAAEAAQSGLLPVAEAFRAAWARDRQLPLLTGDGFHPSAMGTYLAAVVMVAQLENRSPVGLPADLAGRVSVDPAVAVLLQEAAADAIQASDSFLAPAPCQADGWQAPDPLIAPGAEDRLCNRG